MRVAMAREGRTVLEAGVDLVHGVVRTRIAVMPGVDVGIIAFIPCLYGDHCYSSTMRVAIIGEGHAPEYKN